MWKLLEPDKEHEFFGADAFNAFSEKYGNEIEASTAFFFYREKNEIKCGIYTHQERNPSGTIPSEDAKKEAWQRVLDIANRESGIPHPKYIWAIAVYVLKNHLILAPMATHDRVFDVKPLVVNPSP